MILHHLRPPRQPERQGVGHHGLVIDAGAGWQAEFRLLGSIEIVRDGQVLDPLAAQPGCVLAMLLLGEGDVVPTDKLIDAIWGERPPDEPRNAVQVYVSRLRRLLTGAAGVAIGTAGRHGYRMEVPPDSVDIRQFRRLVTEARSAGDDRAAELLDTAVALWRDEPFGGAAGDWLHRQITPTLTEERLRALEERARVFGRLGRHGEAIGELSVLLAEDPTREGVAAELMSALHQTGRTAEALAVYRDLRACLVDELGIEPGETVRRRHESILAGDTDTGEPAGPVVPAQLPGDATLFVGREELVRALCEHLATATGTAPRVAVVTGPGGSGKSTLAIHVGHRVRSAFPDGQLYATLSGGAAPADVLADFLLALGVAEATIPVTVDQRAALFRSTVADRRMLVALDGAVDPAQVRPLLPASPGSAVLITSRSRLAALEVSSRMSVEGLTGRESLDLLASVLGADRVTAEPAAAADLARWCGHLPLALRVSAARLTNRPQWPISALARRLSDERARLDELRLGDLDVRASFALSYRQLDPPAARAFRTWSVAAAGTLPPAAAAAMLGAGSRDADILADALIDLHLVELVAGERLRVHDLLRQLGRDLAAEEDPRADRVDALGRLTAWYTHGFAAALGAAFPGIRHARYLLPGPPSVARFADTTSALSWLDTERSDLVAVVVDGARHEAIPPPDLAWLAANFGRYAGPRGYLTDWRRLCDAAVETAKRFGDRRAEARATIALGAVANRSAELDAAANHLGWAAGELLDSGEATEATAMGNLALVYESLQRRAEVIEHLTRAHDVYRQVGDTRGQATALTHLGRQRVHLGHLDEATDNFGQALSLTESLRATDAQAAAHNGLAEALRRRGQTAEADRHFRRALELVDGTNNLEAEATAWSGLARLNTDAGRAGAAIELLERAVTAYRTGHFDYELASALVELATLLRSVGQRERADTCLTEARTLAAHLAPAQAERVHTGIEAASR
jgi:DNA-binding SARP family transcriptional activator/tetratricopeptide (TPR) repeat protein